MRDWCQRPTPIASHHPRLSTLACEPAVTLHEVALRPALDRRRNSNLSLNRELSSPDRAAGRDGGSARPSLWGGVYSAVSAAMAAAFSCTSAMSPTM